MISHLDLMTLIRRAIRRSGLPFSLTRGFTPRVRISMPEAVKLGVEARDMELSIWLTEHMDPETVSRDLNGTLPEGVEVREMEKRS